jgi:hypothetical protein
MRSCVPRLLTLSALVGTLALAGACTDIPLPALKLDGSVTQPDLLVADTGGQIDDYGQDAPTYWDSSPDANADAFEPLEAGGDQGPTPTGDFDGDGYTILQGDCDDFDAAINPGAKEIPYNGFDDDCNKLTKEDDLDGDGFIKAIDCNDKNIKIFPGANEIAYDGIDQNCDGSDLTDVDMDGYDAKSVGGKDCDDKNPFINPGGVDVCGDTLDQDCSGSDLSCSTVDNDGDGYSTSTGDCNDNDKAINPGATEIPYNGKDDDCKAATKDDDLDGDGFNKVGGKDCNDNDKTAYPGATETPYDGKDQDCDGKDLTDADKDGYDSTKVSGGKDCDDTNQFINPGATEIPFDSTDQDCNGSDLVTQGTFEVASSKYSGWPRVAYNGTNYLVVWNDYGSSSSNRLIRAQRISKTGAKVGSAFTIASTTTPTYVYEPDVASDGSGWLVVWRQYTSATTTTYAIVGQRVTSAGALSGTAITVRPYTSGLYKYRPRVAYGGGKYAVTWRERDQAASPYKYLIMAQVVDATTGALTGTVKQASTATYSNYPSVTYGSAGFMLAWDYSYDVFARGLSTAGAFTTSIVNIAKSTSSTYYTDVAYDGTNYFAAWYDYRNSATTGTDIYGQRFTSTGSLLGTTKTTNIAISKAPLYQYYPAVSYCGGKYNVVFRDARYPTYYTLYYQPVSTSGALLGSTASKNQLLYANTVSVYYPDIDCDGTKFLTVWTEYKSGVSGYKIKGLLVTP